MKLKITMQFQQDTSSAEYMIRAYEAQRINVNGEWLEQSFVISTSSLDKSQWPTSIEYLTAEHLERIFAKQPEVVLIGTGSKQQFPAKELLALAAKHHLSLEIMNSQTACGTYSLLASEGRKVSALIML